MIRLERTEPPAKLVAKAADWTAKLLERRAKEPGYRRVSHQYGHGDVKDALRAMSHGKCFYCESELSEADETVDHFVDLDADPEHAFAWTNLYLCCPGCQHKRTSTPHDAALDPCGDVDPAAHLVFDREIIRPLDASPLGRATIRRYKLDRADLDLRRMKKLQQLHEVVMGLLARHGADLPSAHRERLRAFAQPEHAYSLMFRCVLPTLPVETSS